MAEYYDELKYTIIKMIQKQLNITVLDSPVEKNINNKKYEFPILLFKSYYNNNEKNKFNIIDYEKYDTYGIEEMPNLDISIIKDMYVIFDGQRYKIINYNNGVLEIDTVINNLSAYNDMFMIESFGEDIDLTKDYIIVSSPYSYDNRIDYNTVENFRRFQIDIFLYNDLNDSKVTYNTQEIQRLFNRDFQILDKSGNKIKKQFAYIQSNLTFDIVEYNISNKIVRGSMLIRTYNR